MKNEKGGAWLLDEIKSAKRNKESWPNWMQKAARFEGNVSCKSGGENRLYCRVSKVAK